LGSIDGGEFLASWATISCLMVLVNEVCLFLKAIFVKKKRGKWHSSRIKQPCI
jgi:hypothetical protein